MDSLARIIFEQVAAGKLEQATGVEMLKALKLGHKEKAGDIAVIGLSVNMPGARNIGEFWQAVRGPRDFIREYPAARQQDVKGMIVHFTDVREEELAYSCGGYLDEVDKFDYGFFQLAPNEAALMDPNQRLFLEAAWQAIEDAGYGGGKLAGSRTGVYLGYADWPVYGQYITKKHPAMTQMAGAGNTPSLIASRISYLLDLKGPAFIVDTACSSSLVAVHLACMALKNDECDTAIAGGVKVCLMPVDGVFEMGIESTHRATRTFDDSSDGTMWGEGTAAFVLKPLQQAQADGDAIYAVIKGSAVNQDGTSVGITAPNAAAQAELLTRAWKEAGIEPETITLFEAHGTGTKLGDPIELDGIQTAFRRFTDKKQFCAIGSVKTHIGHLDSASGVAGLLKSIAALQYRELPPTLHFSRPNRKISFESSPVYVNDRVRPWTTDGFPRRSGVSSFGFSGTNCHVVLEEAPAVARRQTADGWELLVLSAKSQAGVTDLLHAYAELFAGADVPLEDVCYTAGTGRGHYQHRLAITARNAPELRRKLERLLASGPLSDAAAGIAYGEHRVVALRREQRQPGEWTAEELRQLNEQAGAVVEQIRRDRGRPELWAELGALYARGAVIDWEYLYEGAGRRKARVPLYPFQRTRCWIEEAQEAAGSPAVAARRAAEQEARRQQPVSVRLEGRPDGQYTPTEMRLAQAWSQVLGVPVIDVYDDFFELGGNSILAIRVEVELERCGLTITSDDLYVHRTVKQLAEHLTGAAAGGESDGSTAAQAQGAALENPAEQQTEADAHGGEESGGIVLANIEPFNDIFFKNCFYNSMFPVVRHFGENILPFMLNDLILYEFSGNQCRMQYESVYPLERICKLVHLHVDVHASNEHVVRTLTSSIAQGHPAVIWVDAYHESIRNDAYRKQHMDHTLLVYGFNPDEELFHIIEHERRENLSYKPCVIPYRDIVEGSRGFTELYVDTGQHAATHYIFRHEPGLEPLSPDALKEMFADQLFGHRGSIADSLKALERFVDSYRQLVASEEALSREIEPLVNFLNDAISAKHVEKYRLDLLFGAGSAAAALLDPLIRKWDFVRKGMVRFMYAPQYKPDVFEAALGKLAEIIADERQFIDTLYGELEAYAGKRQHL